MLKTKLKKILINMGILPAPYLPKKSKLLTNTQPCKIGNFGELNGDKIFYVIKQEGRGRGLFSIVASVLCHLNIAEEHGWMPIIDFENFKNIYNEANLINGTNNSWEYYFYPVQKYKLDEVYSSKNVIISDDGYPVGYNYSITGEKRLYSIFLKYFKVKSDIILDIDKFYNEHFLGRRVLGVHFRGQEMRTARGHPFPPTKKQMVYRIKKIIQEYNFNEIFVVSEDANYIDFLKKEFPGIISTNNYRTYGKNAYNQYPREDHIYKLGREILIDSILLSKCHGLIGCGSNVSTFSRFINNGSYEIDERISNGRNSNNIIISKLLWSIKAILPSSLGGFTK